MGSKHNKGGGEGKKYVDLSILSMKYILQEGKKLQHVDAIFLTCFPYFPLGKGKWALPGPNPTLTRACRSNNSGLPGSATPTPTESKDPWCLDKSLFKPWVVVDAALKISSSGDSQSS